MLGEYNKSLDKNINFIVYKFRRTLNRFILLLYRSTFGKKYGK